MSGVVGTLTIYMDDGEGQQEIASILSASLQFERQMLPALHPDAYGWDYFVPGNSDWRAEGSVLQLIDTATQLRESYLQAIEAFSLAKTLLDFVFDSPIGEQYTGQGYIDTFQLGGAHSEGFAGVFGVQGVGDLVVASDITPTTMWWINDSTTESVYKAAIDNETVPWTQELVGSFDSGYSANDIQVDPAAGWIFTEESNGAGQSVINRRSLAWGTKTEIISRSQSTNFIFSMCIHRRSRRVYWIQDNGTSGYTIERCDYEGNNVETVGTVTVVGTAQGKSLCIDQSGIYAYFHHGVAPSVSHLKRLTISSGVISDLNTSFPLNISGDSEEAVVDQNAGTAGKIYMSGVITAVTEGIYEIDLSAPTTTSYLDASPVADNQAVARDRSTGKIYYVDRTVLDDIMRMDDDGTNEEEVIASTTGDDVKSIDLGVD